MQVILGNQAMGNRAAHEGAGNQAEGCMAIATALARSTPMFSKKGPKAALVPWPPTSGTEPAQKVHAHREILHPLYKRIIMLLSKHRCRNEVHHLLTFLHCLKCGADCHFCLPVSDIPAD